MEYYGLTSVIAIISRTFFIIALIPIAVTAFLVVGDIALWFWRLASHNWARRRQVRYARAAEVPRPRTTSSAPDKAVDFAAMEPARPAIAPSQLAGQASSQKAPCLTQSHGEVARLWTNMNPVQNDK
ncbi:hypothetical protein VTI74DRAFT_1680 [Chaetomium olivicolor]